MRAGGPWVTALMFVEAAEYAPDAGWKIGPAFDHFGMGPEAVGFRMRIKLLVHLYTDGAIGGVKLLVRVVSDSQPDMIIAEDIKEFNGIDEHLALIRDISLPITANDQLFVAEVLVEGEIIARSPLRFDFEEDLLPV